jgi:hypothetical protein
VLFPNVPFLAVLTYFAGAGVPDLYGAALHHLSADSGASKGERGPAGLINDLRSEVWLSLPRAPGAGVAPALAIRGAVIGTARARRCVTVSLRHWPGHRAHAGNSRTVLRLGSAMGRQVTWAPAAWQECRYWMFESGFLPLFQRRTFAARVSQGGSYSAYVWRMRCEVYLMTSSLAT